MHEPTAWGQMGYGPWGTEYGSGALPATWGMQRIGPHMMHHIMHHHMLYHMHPSEMMPMHGGMQHGTQQTGGLQPMRVAFPPGQVVLPSVAHKPEHRDRAARVAQVVTNQPFYVLDFGDGQLHRWYAQDELKLAPAGTRAGQTVPGSTGEQHGH